MCTDSSIYLSYPILNGYCGELFVINFIILETAQQMKTEITHEDSTTFTMGDVPIKTAVVSQLSSVQCSAEKSREEVSAVSVAVY
jgi:hypothetical protein